MDQEARCIEAFYIAHGFDTPNMTVIISTKNNRTRFFPETQSDIRMNVPPGLVVFDDLLLAESSYTNFYMVSHAGNQHVLSILMVVSLYHHPICQLIQLILCY